MLNLLCDVSCDTCCSVGSELDYSIFLHCRPKTQISLVKINGGERGISPWYNFRIKSEQGPRSRSMKTLPSSNCALTNLWRLSPALYLYPLGHPYSHLPGMGTARLQNRPGLTPFFSPTGGAVLSNDLGNLTFPFLALLLTHCMTLSELWRCSRTHSLTSKNKITIATLCIRRGL